MILAVTITIMTVLLVLFLIRLALKLAWGLIKFLFGLGLFALCPVLCIVLGILGLLGTGWWIIAIIAVISGIGFGKS